MTCKAIEDMKIEWQNIGEAIGIVKGEVRGSVLTAMNLGKSKQEAIQYVCKISGVDEDTVESYLSNKTDLK